MIRQLLNGAYIMDLDDLTGPKSKFAFLADKDSRAYEQDFDSMHQIMEFYQAKSVSESGKEIQPINEATRRELLKEADDARKKRAKKLTTKFVGVHNTKGWVIFNTNSQYTPGKKYVQYIQLAEAKDMKYFKEFKPREIIRLFLTGDLKVWCSCPDFRYRMKYMAYGLGYGLFKEIRFPRIRNPKLEGSVCKHLICVFNVMMMNHTSIEKHMLNTKFFQNKKLDQQSVPAKKAGKTTKVSGKTSDKTKK